MKKNLLKRIIRKVKRLLNLKIFSEKIKNNFWIRKFFKKYKDYTIVWCYPHIGDAFMAMPFVEEYKKKNNVKILVIGNQKYDYLYKIFDKNNEFNYYFCSEKDMMRFSYNNNFSFTNSFIMKKVKENKYINNEIYYMQKFYNFKEKEGAFNYTKRVIYGLDENIQIQLPKITTSRCLSKNKYIIISPYAQSAKLINLEEYDKLISKLKDEGYDVYTNAYGQEKELNGTKRLECSLIELCEYANSAVAFIGIRSGICDMLAMLTNVNMYVFDNMYMNNAFLCLLNEVRTTNTIFEYFGTDYQLYFDDILKHLENKNGN